MKKLPGNRQTRFVNDVEGVTGFTELILTQEERGRLAALKFVIVGCSVILSPEAFNRIDNAAKIIDIRIVFAQGQAYPCAILDFETKGYIRLRALEDLVFVDDGAESLTSDVLQLASVAKLD